MSCDSSATCQIENPTPCLTMPALCTPAPCGDDVLATGACDAVCRTPGTCGDGVLDSSFGEACDLGASNGKAIDIGNGQSRVICDEDCQLVID